MTLILCCALSTTFNGGFLLVSIVASTTPTLLVHSGKFFNFFFTYFSYTSNTYFNIGNTQYLLLRLHLPSLPLPPWTDRSLTICFVNHIRLHLHYCSMLLVSFRYILTIAINPFSFKFVVIHATPNFFLYTTCNIMSNIVLSYVYRSILVIPTFIIHSYFYFIRTLKAIQHI